MGASVDAMFDLIVRCEQAAGGDIGLDDLLHELLPEPKVVQPPPYTRNLSAALALLPDGADWRRLTSQSMSAYAANPYNAQAQKRHDGFGATPALQMCAAALKVRVEPMLKAIATEARRAATGNTDAVHEGAGLKGIAQNTPPESHP